MTTPAAVPDGPGRTDPVAATSSARPTTSSTRPVVAPTGPGARPPRATAAPPQQAALAGTAGAIEVLHPGALTLVQDRGRPGYASIGVGRSGAADAGALRLANRLVGNDPAAAGLEVLLGGIELRFTAPAVLALAGAVVPAELDLPGAPPVPVGAQQAVRVPAGAVLRTGHAVHGLRLYLAVRGGVDVPPVLGSRATDQLSGLGPAPVRAGDLLPVGRLGGDAAQPWPEPPRSWPGTAQQPGPAVLRVLPGPRPGWFAPDALGALAGAGYRVTPASNRVALRLDGPPVRRTDRGELPSEPLVPGAVQVPPDGRPVVFGADHPVTGGYPVLAVVLPQDLDLAAQLAPGAPVRLVPVGEPRTPGAAWPGPSV